MLGAALPLCLYCHVVVAIVIVIISCARIKNMRRVMYASMIKTFGHEEN